MSDRLGSTIADIKQPKERRAELRRTLAYRFSRPLVGLLARSRLSPNAISGFGFLLSVVVAWLIPSGHLLASGVVMLVAGFFDILDGAVARRMDRVTRFGAVLDSSLDRLSEVAIFGGILVWYARAGSVGGVILVLVTTGLSFLVSYIRARAEGVGLSCRLGWFTRPERVVLLALGLLLNQLTIVLIIIAGFSLFTAGQRLVYVYQQAKRDDS